MMNQWNSIIKEHKNTWQYVNQEGGENLNHYIYYVEMFSLRRSQITKSYTRNLNNLYEYYSLVLLTFA